MEHNPSIVPENDSTKATGAVSESASAGGAPIIDAFAVVADPEPVSAEAPLEVAHDPVIKKTEPLAKHATETAETVQESAVPQSPDHKAEIYRAAVEQIRPDDLGIPDDFMGETTTRPSVPASIFGRLRSGFDRLVKELPRPDFGNPERPEIKGEGHNYWKVAAVVLVMAVGVLWARQYYVDSTGAMLSKINALRSDLKQMELRAKRVEDYLHLDIPYAVEIPSRSVTAIGYGLYVNNVKGEVVDGVVRISGEIVNTTSLTFRDPQFKAIDEAEQIFGLTWLDPGEAAAFDFILPSKDKVPAKIGVRFESANINYRRKTEGTWKAEQNHAAGGMKEF